MIFALPAFVSADSVQIINNVSASASTGGNAVSNGETVEGTNKSSVKVYTKVNGEVVEDFQKEIVGEQEFEFESKKETGGAKVETKVKVNVASSSLTATGTDVSKAVFDTFRETFRQKVRQLFKYVFSFFKFQ